MLHAIAGHLMGHSAYSKVFSDQYCSNNNHISTSFVSKIRVVISVNVLCTRKTQNIKGPLLYSLMIISYL